MGYTCTNNYSLFIWYIDLTGCLIFYLATLLLSQASPSTGSGSHSPLLSVEPFTLDHLDFLQKHLNRLASGHQLTDDSRALRIGKSQSWLCDLLPPHPGFIEGYQCSTG